MKSIDASIIARAATGAALGVLSAASSAHGGHSVAAGSSPHQHLHVFGSIAVAPGALVMLGFAALAVLVLLLRPRRAKGH